LPGSWAYDLEVFIGVQDREAGEFCGGGDDEVGDGRGVVRGRQTWGQDLDRAVLDRRGLERPLSPGEGTFPAPWM